MYGILMFVLRLLKHVIRILTATNCNNVTADNAAYRLWQTKYHHLPGVWLKDATSPSLWVEDGSGNKMLDRIVLYLWVHAYIRRLNVMFRSIQAVRITLILFFLVCGFGHESVAFSILRLRDLGVKMISRYLLSTVRWMVCRLASRGEMVAVLQ